MYMVNEHRQNKLFIEYKQNILVIQ